MAFIYSLQHFEYKIWVLCPLEIIGITEVHKKLTKKLSGQLQPKKSALGDKKSQQFSTFPFPIEYSLQVLDDVKILNNTIHRRE